MASSMLSARSHRLRPARHFAILALVAGIALPGGSPLHAQLVSQRSIPTTYAITNAKIVPVTGPALAKGTIVIRNGLIAAVGSAVTVPGDARVIDGAGLTVYPGFIDSYGSLGLSAAPVAASAGRAGGGGGGGRGGGGAAVTAGSAISNYPAGLQPELLAAEQLKPDADSFTGAQSAGFTAALTAPSAGIFQGQSAFINLADGDAAGIIIKAPVAQHIGFTPLRNGGFPNSLMGVFAALRQQFLDAQHYRDEQGAYTKNPRGMTRPAFDPSLEALQPVINGKVPVIMFANTQREIERALDLAKEFDLKTIIAGGSEANLVSARLKAENVPVLLSTNFPRRTVAPSADADPEPIRVLRERVDAPKVPGELARDGVKFALQSGGTAGLSEFQANIQRAVEQGLPIDGALRALTLTPAEIFGVSDRLGSIEVGKIANLTITKGDLAERGTRIAQLFVDGKPVAVQQPVAGGRGGGGGRGGDAAQNAAAATAASGSWTVTVTIDGTDYSVSLALRQEGERLTGSLQGSLGTSEVGGGSIAADNSFRFTSAITLKEGTEEATFIGNVEGNALRGRLQIVGHTPGTFAGTRPERTPRP
ncbi:MAG: amidohydrolase family protein [Gemmatimonadaceae bacterium]